MPMMMGVAASLVWCLQRQPGIAFLGNVQELQGSSYVQSVLRMASRSDKALVCRVSRPLGRCWLDRCMHACLHKHTHIHTCTHHNTWGWSTHYTATASSSANGVRWGCRLAAVLITKVWSVIFANVCRVGQDRTIGNIPAKNTVYTPYIYNSGKLFNCVVHLFGRNKALNVGWGTPWVAAGKMPKCTHTNMQTCTHTHTHTPFTEPHHARRKTTNRLACWAIKQQWPLYLLLGLVSACTVPSKNRRPLSTVFFRSIVIVLCNTSVRVCMRVFVYVCVRVCVRVCICLCMCVCP